MGSGIMRGLAIAIFVSVVVGGAAYQYLDLGNKRETPSKLAAQAMKALTAVQKRTLKGTLRPATYDAILGPLDKLLRMAKEATQNPEYDPLNDYERVRSYVEPVIEIAQLAHEQSLKETSVLRKNYRFMEQKAEACQYLAAAIWNRLEAMYNQSPPPNGAAFIPSPTDSERLYGVLDAGLAADPENKQLWYLHSAVARVNGSFVLAEKDLRKALDLDPDFVAAWNDLGLTLISLKRFNDAERALDKAKEKSGEAARRAGVPPGSEYATALFNLAQFHQALATYYQRAARTDSTSENQAELARHEQAAQAFMQELIAIEPADSVLVKELKEAE